jgi:hypothetical protein
MCSVEYPRKGPGGEKDVNRLTPLTWSPVENNPEHLNVNGVDLITIYMIRVSDLPQPFHDGPSPSRGRCCNVVKTRILRHTRVHVVAGN